MWGDTFTVSMSKSDFENLLEEKLQKVLQQLIVKNPDSILRPKIEEKLVTIKRVMELFDVSKQTIYNWTKQKVITPVKIGGKVMYDIAKIKEDYRSNKTAFTKRKWSNEIQKVENNLV